MATDPKDHPLHQVPDNLPRPPGDLPPSTDQPAPAPSQPQPVPAGGSAGNSGPSPYAGEVEDENADPVGQPPRM